MIGVSPSTVTRMANRGEFPRPLRLSRGRVGWLRETVERWLAEREAASRRPAAAAASDEPAPHPERDDTPPASEAPDGGPHVDGSRRPGETISDGQSHAGAPMSGVKRAVPWGRGMSGHARGVSGSRGVEGRR